MISSVRFLIILTLLSSFSLSGVMLVVKDSTIDLEAAGYKGLKEASIVLRDMAASVKTSKKQRVCLTQFTLHTLLCLAQMIQGKEHIEGSLTAAQCIAIIEAHHYLNIDEAKLSKTLLFDYLDNLLLDENVYAAIVHMPTELQKEFFLYSYAKHNDIFSRKWKQGAVNVLITADGKKLVDCGTSSAQLSANGAMTVYLEASRPHHITIGNQEQHCLGLAFPCYNRSTVALSADGKKIVAGAKKRLHIFDVISMDGTCGTRYGTRECFNECFAHEICAVAISNDGHLVAMGCDKWVGIINDGKVLDTYLAFQSPVRKIAVSADGTMVMATNGTTVKLFDLRCKHEIHHAINGLITSIALSADGAMAVIGSTDKKMYMLNTRTGRCTQKDFADAVTSVAVSTNGRIAIGGSNDTTVHSIDVATGKLLNTLHFDAPVCSVACSADGHRIIAGSQDGTVQWYNIPSREALATLSIQRYLRNKNIYIDTEALNKIRKKVAAAKRLKLH